MVSWDPEALHRGLQQSPSLRARGRVRSVTGLALELELPCARLGDIVTIERRGAPLLAEIVGFRPDGVVALPLGDLNGTGVDDPVESRGAPLTVSVGQALLGRVVDSFGRPLDGEPLPEGLTPIDIERAAPPALSRAPVCEPLATGVRVIDGLLTLGAGQRVGLFAGSGVGKSTLLGAMAHGTSADVVVVALVGERGREVGEFLTHCLGESRHKSVVVVATSDAPALQRLKAPLTATAIAEHFRDQGQRVLLLVDSVTRYARALREVGLAAGEPPARRGYPPSVFAALPRLLERGGTGACGSITGIYTVLVEGGNMEEPIADEVRGILDGHIVLDRAIAARGRYPAVDVGNSLSRVMGQCVSKEQQVAAATIRRLLAAFEEKRDLIALGAYAKGSDATVDQAIAAMPALEQLLQQSTSELTPFEETLQRMSALASRYG